MFREMRRFKQQVSQDECKKILKDEKRAAFSVIGDEASCIIKNVDVEN